MDSEEGAGLAAVDSSSQTRSLHGPRKNLSSRNGIPEDIEMRHLSLRCGVVLCLLVGCSSTKQLVQRVNPLKPTDHTLQFELARASEADGHLVKAERVYRSLCESEPNHAKYHHRLGVVLLRLGQPVEGLQELNHASQLEPTDLNILNDVGYGYLRSGDTPKAIETLTKARKIDPQNKRTNNNLALALGYQGELRESFKIFQQTMTESEALANLGYLATQSGKTDLAIKAYSRALTQDPDMKSAAEALAQLGTIHQDLESSRSIAADLDPTTPKSMGIAHTTPARSPEKFALAEAGVSSAKSSKMSANQPVWVGEAK